MRDPLDGLPIAGEVDWSDRPTPGRRRATNAIVVHCSATAPGDDISAFDIDDWHRRGNGWAGIGYHLYTPRDGSLWAGRPIHANGAHCTQGDLNFRSIGICLEGGLGADREIVEDGFEPAQLDTLRLAVDHLMAVYGIDPGQVIGHRDAIKRWGGAPKACPTMSVKAWLAGGDMGVRLGDELSFRPVLDAADQPSSPLSIPATYLVKPGDTLYGLRKRFGVSFEQMRAANNWPGTDPNRWPLIAGRTIKLMEMST